MLRGLSEFNKKFYSSWSAMIPSRGPFYWKGLTLIPPWIINNIHYKVWDVTTHPFLNFNSCTVEVKEWKLISSHTSLSIWLVIHDERYIWSNHYSVKFMQSIKWWKGESILCFLTFRQCLVAQSFSCRSNLSVYFEKKCDKCDLLIRTMLVLINIYSCRWFSKRWDYFGSPW